MGKGEIMNNNDLVNPLDVTPEEKKEYPWTQADQTPEIDTLANDAGADSEIEKPVVILVNRHERRKRAKLARLEAAMEKAEGQRLRAKGKNQ
jgi:hypothetical protein